MIYLKFLREILKKNIGKSIMFTLGIITYVFAGTISPSKCTIDVLDTNVIVIGRDTTNVYLYKESKESSISCVSFHDAQKILPGNIIEYTQYNILNIFLWVAFGVCCICVIVGLLASDDELSWEFRECWKEALFYDIKTFEENGTFFWTLHGRLLYRSQSCTPSGYDLKQLIRDYIRNRHIYPNFSSIEEKRNDKLNKIGI